MGRQINKKFFLKNSRMNIILDSKYLNYEELVLNLGSKCKSIWPLQNMSNIKEFQKRNSLKNLKIHEKKQKQKQANKDLAKYVI